jgi:Relaxase/Mobilisation nuclease domain
MIIKIKTHKRPSFKALINYMIHDKDRLFDEKGKSFLLTHNVKGKNMDGWVRQFEKNETFRLRKRSDSVYCTHEILSWHRDDAKNIQPEMLESMVKEYIRLRNSGGMFIAAAHYDRSHYHVHICASGIEYRTGKTMRLSKVSLQKLKKDIQNYQIEKFPELSKSIVRHGSHNKLKNDKEIQFKLRSGRESDKEQLLGILKTCYKNANSKETFFELLAECGVKNYERGGKMSGVVFQDRKFRLWKLGIGDDRISELNKTIHRKKELISIRDYSKSIEVEKKGLFK